MPKVADELDALEVKRLKGDKLHAVGGVPGLHLQISNKGAAKSWVLRVTVGTKRRDVGLGGFPAVPLALARDKARAKREAIEKGLDPVLERRDAKAQLMAAQRSSMTFAGCADGCIKSKEGGWSNPKHAKQWRTTLQTHAYPVLGNLFVRDITATHVEKVLEPIWTERHETATRVRSRIETVLGWAIAKGYRPEPNPARMKDNLDKMLPDPTRASWAKVEHFAAVPVDEMPAFMAALRRQEGMAAVALRFAALTAARSGEVRGALWKEIDFKNRAWIVPEERVKARRVHRVPLSDAAIKLLVAIRARDEFDSKKELIFPAANGGQLSDMTLSAVMRRMELDAVPHGLRSTFRDWCAERTTYPRQLAETALAHNVAESETEGAYLRSDLFDQRRRMMTDWAKFCASPAQKTAKVIALKKRSAR